MGAYHKSEQESLRDELTRLRALRDDARWRRLCDELEACARGEGAEREAALEALCRENGLAAAASADVVHHFNNVLMGILGAAQVAARTLDAADQARAYVDQIAAQARRGVDFSSKLLALTPKTEVGARPAPCTCERDASAHASNAAPAGAQRVLLVEDERLIRITLRHELQSLGYQVECACDGHEAAKHIEARREPLDVLLTDVVVPGPTGPEIAKLAHARWPHAHVIFMSAFPRDVLLQQGRIQPDQTTLEKPFTEEQLVGKLRELESRG